MKLRHVLSVAFIGLLVVLGACGGDDDAASIRSTTAVVSTSASPTSITQAASTTTTTTASTTTTTTTQVVTTTTSATTTTIDTNALADGSGCTPGTETLPDGEWFGYAGAGTGSDLEFDLACWFSEPAATIAAAEDGAESPPPNGYHIRNENPALREVSVDSGAGVRWMPNPGDPAAEELIPYPDWLGVRNSRSFQPAVWLIIADGVITEIREQYQP